MKKSLSQILCSSLAVAAATTAIAACSPTPANSDAAVEAGCPAATDVRRTDAIATEAGCPAGCPAPVDVRSLDATIEAGCPAGCPAATDASRG